MADLTALQVELETIEKAIQDAREAQFQAILAKRKEEEETLKVAEAAKTSEQKEIELQDQINEKKAHLEQINSQIQ